MAVDPVEAFLGAGVEIIKNLEGRPQVALEEIDRLKSLVETAAEKIRILFRQEIILRVEFLDVAGDHLLVLNLTKGAAGVVVVLQEIHDDARFALQLAGLGRGELGGDRYGVLCPAKGADQKQTERKGAKTHG